MGNGIRLLGAGLGAGTGIGLAFAFGDALKPGRPLEVVVFFALVGAVLGLIAAMNIQQATSKS